MRVYGNEPLIVFTGEFMRSLSDYSIVYPEKVSNNGRVRRNDRRDNMFTFRIIASGRSLMFDLYRSTEFMSPNLVLLRYMEGSMVEEQLDDESRLCHCVGEVRGHIGSRVVLKTCRGLVRLI